MKRFTCMPIIQLPRLARQSENAWSAKMRNAHIHRLTDRQPIKLTSMRSCQYRWQHNEGRHPLIKLVSTVQINQSASHRHYSNPQYPRRRLSHNTDCFLPHLDQGQYLFLGPQPKFQLIIEWVHKQNRLPWLVYFSAYIRTCDRIHNSKIEYTLILI